MKLWVFLLFRFLPICLAQCCLTLKILERNSSSHLFVVFSFATAHHKENGKTAKFENDILNLFASYNDGNIKASSKDGGVGGALITWQTFHQHHHYNNPNTSAM